MLGVVTPAGAAAGATPAVGATEAGPMQVAPTLVGSAGLQYHLESSLCMPGTSLHGLDRAAVGARTRRPVLSG